MPTECSATFKNTYQLVDLGFLQNRTHMFGFGEDLSLHSVKQNEKPTHAAYQLVCCLFIIVNNTFSFLHGCYLCTLPEYQETGTLIIKILPNWNYQG